jgi:hypothetical protein
VTSLPRRHVTSGTKLHIDPSPFRAGTRSARSDSAFAGPSALVDTRRDLWFAASASACAHGARSRARAAVPTETIVNCGRQGHHETTGVRRASRKCSGRLAASGGRAAAGEDHWLPRPTTPAPQWIAVFVKRLRELGWTEGRDISIEYRFASCRGGWPHELRRQYYWGHQGVRTGRILAGPSRRTSQSSRPRKLSCSLTSRPSRRSASLSRARCSAARTRRSNDDAICCGTRVRGWQKAADANVRLNPSLAEQLERARSTPKRPAEAFSPTLQRNFNPNATRGKKAEGRHE